MIERIGQGANDLKTHLLPQTDCARIGRYNEIVLHRSETHFASAAKRVFAHLSRNASTARFSRSDVAAITDMSGRPELVWFDEIGAEDLTVRLGNKGLFLPA